MIQPHVIGFLLPIPIHLKRDIDLIRVPVRLGRVVRIHVISSIVHLQRNVVHLIPHALQRPDKMNPRIRRKVRAGYICWHPHSARIIPDVPFLVRIEVTLRSPRPARSAEGLVYVKFQRLRRGTVIDVKVQMVREARDVISASQR